VEPQCIDGILITVKNMKKEVKQVIVMRIDTEPKMRRGKSCAQAAHASLAVLLDRLMPPYETRQNLGGGSIIVNEILREGEPMYEWLTNSFVKIVLQGTLTDVVDSYNKAKADGIPCALIEDKGLTEFGGEITITCCAIGPDDPEKIDKITGHLKLL